MPNDFTPSASNFVGNAKSPSPSSGDTPVTVASVLLSGKQLTQAQYDDLRVKSALQGRPIDTILEASGIVTEDAFTRAKSVVLNVPYISLKTTAFAPEAINLVPKPVAERFVLIPFQYDEKSRVLSLAMSNPADLEAISFLRQKTGDAIKVHIAVKSEIQQAIDEQYKQELVTDVGQALKETVLQKTAASQSTFEANIQDAPIVKIVATILEYAVQARASDIHIEPLDDRVRVRYRIDGILYDKLSLPKGVQEAVVSRVKVLSGMKLDEHRVPQDGRINFKFGNQEVDLRISDLPTVNGEKIVIRLLPKGGKVPTLSELGLTGTSLKNLETSILRPHGVIIVCGPTGSGKTTTLYAVLSRLNTTRINIVSIEDPVEYQIVGVNQVQVNPSAGLTFATGLRSFLRQDPNIILVGEMRDQETMDLGIQAALTGHLVLSTLHTSNAAGALPRLLDLQAESFLLASTINAIVGQRIVRKICNNCKESYEPLRQILIEIQHVLGNLFPQSSLPVKLYKGKGCLQCGGTGYLGRIGIFEVLPVSARIGQLVLEHQDSNTIEKQAVVEGMITMKQDGYLKVLKGITSVEEVLRVAQE